MKWAFVKELKIIHGTYLVDQKGNHLQLYLTTYQEAIIIIDESHVTVPQLGGMYKGDRSRKENLVNFGFRLPSALDNRPLKFEEFEKIVRQTIFVSATPADYEKRIKVKLSNKWFVPLD